MIYKLIANIYIGIALMSNSIIIDNTTLIGNINNYTIITNTEGRFSTEDRIIFSHDLSNFNEQERTKVKENLDKIINRKRPMLIKHDNFKMKYIRAILCDNVIIGRDEPSRIFISLGRAPGVLFIDKNTPSYDKLLELNYLFSQKQSQIFDKLVKTSNVKLSVVVNEPDFLVLYIGYHPEICN